MNLGDELMRGPKLGDPALNPLRGQARRMYQAGGWTHRSLAAHLKVPQGTMTAWLRGISPKGGN